MGSSAGAMEITADIIYLMGGSFIVGSLFTLLLLVLLEMIRRLPPGNNNNET